MASLSTQRRPAPGRAVEVALGALVAASILFFGGVHAAFCAAALLTSFACSVAYPIRAFDSGRLQISLGPLHVAALAGVGAGAAQLATRLTLDRAATGDALLRIGYGALVLILTSSFATERRSLCHLALVFALLGAFESLYGIAEHFSGHEHILLWPKTYPGTVSGTYVNRNHFAGMLALCTPVALGLALSQPSTWRSSLPSFRTKLALAIDDPALWKRTLLFAAAAVSGLGVCVSLSRGGLLSLVFGLVVFGLLTARRARGRAVRFLGPLALLAVMGLGFMAFGPQKLVARFSDMRTDVSGESEVSRVAFARATLRMIADHPLTGVGLGAWEAAYPRYQQGSTGGMRVDHAHNDLLQIPAEIGLPAALLVALALAVTVRRAIRWAREQDDRSAVLMYGLIGGLSAAMAHALVDFDLQLAGSLALTALVCGLIAAPVSRVVELRGWAARGVAAALILAMIPLVPFPLRVIRAELLAHPTVRQQDDARPAAERVAALERAIELRPEKVEYRLDAVASRREAFDEAVERAAREAARNLTGPAGPEAAEPPQALVRSLQASIRASRAAEEAAVVERNLADLRAARAAEPGNARVLAEIARFTPDRAEAWQVSAEATRAAAFWADTLVRAGLGRLRFDRRDPEAASWLSRGLALEPRRTRFVTRQALRAGSEEAVAEALPGQADAARVFVSLMVRQERWDLARKALDRLPAIEDAAGAVAPEAGSPAGAKVEPGEAPGSPLTIRPTDWLDKPEGNALEPLRADVLRLLPGRAAHARAARPGALALEISTLPGQRPAFLCVLHDGRHLGHALATDGWATHRFSLPAAGWIGLAPARDRHRLDVPSATVVVRDAVISAPR